MCFLYGMKWILYIFLQGMRSLKECFRDCMTFPCKFDVANKSFGRNRLYFHCFCNFSYHTYSFITPTFRVRKSLASDLTRLVSFKMNAELQHATWRCKVTFSCKSRTYTTYACQLLRRLTFSAISVFQHPVALVNDFIRMGSLSARLLVELVDCWCYVSLL
jgi:hypothetical protein